MATPIEFSPELQGPPANDAPPSQQTPKTRPQGLDETHLPPILYRPTITLGIPKSMPPEYAYTIQDVSEQDPLDANDNDVPVNKPTSFNGRLNQYFHTSKTVNGGREQNPKSKPSVVDVLAQDNDTRSSGSSSDSKRRPRRPRPLDQNHDPNLSNSTDSTPSSINPPSKRRKTRTTTTTTRSRRTPSSKPAPSPSPSPPASSSLLRDTIPANLTLLLVGVNPGILTGTTGFAYAHPSNLFWKLLHSSGITTTRHPPSDTYRLPELYNIGNTNIVERPTRDASMLSKAEMDAGVPVLEAKVAAQRPRAVCLVGKSIWEAVWRVRKGRGIRKEEFRYGWQGEGENMGTGEGWEGAPVFVATTTSGLAAGMTMAQKEEVWNELGRWVVGRREEMKKELAEGDAQKETSVEEVHE